MRVLEWIIDRCEGRANAVETPIGYVPTYDELNWTGTDFSKEEFDLSLLKTKINGLKKSKATLSYLPNLVIVYHKH
jgi:GTP-dependent phosphoenolpyruvate carboxykinase